MSLDASTQMNTSRLQAFAWTDEPAQLNPQLVENMSMLLLFSFPVGVVALLAGWLFLVDRIGLEDSGGNPRAVKRKEWL